MLMDIFRPCSQPGAASAPGLDLTAPGAWGELLLLQDDPRVAGGAGQGGAAAAEGGEGAERKGLTKGQKKRLKEQHEQAIRWGHESCCWSLSRSPWQPCRSMFTTSKSVRPVSAASLTSGPPFPLAGISALLVPSRTFSHRSTHLRTLSRSWTCACTVPWVFIIPS